MNDYFFIRAEVKKEKVMKKLDPLQVTRLSTVKNYTTIYLVDGKSYTVRKSLVSTLDHFPPGMFVRIDRAEVVSVYYIDYITKDHLILNGKPVSIHRAYYKYTVNGINLIE